MRKLRTRCTKPHARPVQILVVEFYNFVMPLQVNVKGASRSRWWHVKTTCDWAQMNGLEPSRPAWRIQSCCTAGSSIVWLTRAPRTTHLAAAETGTPTRPPIHACTHAHSNGRRYIYKTRLPEKQKQQQCGDGFNGLPTDRYWGGGAAGL